MVCEGADVTIDQIKTWKQKSGAQSRPGVPRHLMMKTFKGGIKDDGRYHKIFYC